ncbi:MAG: VWA domain-containing protein [Edaphobacter sp.]
MKKVLAGCVILMTLATAARGQETPAPKESQDAQETTTLTARATLVLVPTLVTTKAGAPVYTLKADDFVVTDDGVPQKVTLEENLDGEPMALVVVVQTGGPAAQQLDKYRRLGTMVEAMVGGVPHKVAVVDFDSEPALRLGFTDNLDKVGDTIANLEPGDGGGAIFDGVGFALKMLRKQPSTYRRAVLLISETVDHGSKLSAADALKTISDTNTAIYSVAFSSSRSELKRDSAANLPHSGGDVDPGPPGGCMAKDPDKADDPTQTKAKQVMDCAGVLLPPLLLAKAAVTAAMNGFRRNVPETVARVSGGEYFKFSGEKALEQDLARLSNHVGNRYILSFHPQTPHAGFHAIGVTMTDYNNLRVSARNGYWFDAEPQ